MINKVSLIKELGLIPDGPNLEDRAMQWFKMISNPSLPALSYKIELLIQCET